MSDRLAELRRQRALVQEHLAWLEREIAQAERTPVEAATFPPPFAAPAFRATSPVESGLAAPPVMPAGTEAADQILDKYRVPATSVQSDVRKGCFLYLVAAFLLVGAVVTILYFTVSRR